ncbi:hypothetical protein [Bradyrhizobium retamae]|uniref:hypothetical protein n=1 Tax=Bradyrhizobium retamae TaxID=1300035 RepID=UPI00070BE8F4|nr:hypothetical protein [Bradyrhizobium retamae]
MTNCKKLSLGLVAATMLATPAMAQVVYQEPGVTGYSHPNSAYVTGGYGVRTTTPPGYYYGNRFHPAPRVGAFASQPWDDGSYYIEREY